ERRPAQRTAPEAGRGFRGKARAPCREERRRVKPVAGMTRAARKGAAGTHKPRWHPLAADPRQGAQPRTSKTPPPPAESQREHPSERQVCEIRPGLYLTSCTHLRARLQMETRCSTAKAGSSRLQIWKMRQTNLRRAVGASTAFSMGRFLRRRRMSRKGAHEAALEARNITFCPAQNPRNPRRPRLTRIPAQGRIRAAKPADNDQSRPVSEPAALV